MWLSTAVANLRASLQLIRGLQSGQTLKLRQCVGIRTGDYLESLHLAQPQDEPAVPVLVRPGLRGHAAELRRALAWLDGLLREALNIASRGREPATGSESFRGLHITEAEVARLLKQPPGEPLLAARDVCARREAVPVPRALEPFVREYGLDEFDVALMLIAAAPELDLRYERLYAYLQDDVERRRPTVDLALDLLCGSLASKVQRRAHFASDAPLVVHRLIHLSSPAAAADSPLLAQRLRLEPQVLAALLGEPSLDARLAGACRLWQPAAGAGESLPQTSPAHGLPALARRCHDAGESLRLYLQGPGHDDKRSAAAGIATALGAMLLEVDLARLTAAPSDFEQALQLIGREAWLKGCVVHFDEADTLLRAPDPQARRRFAHHLSTAAGITLVCGQQAWGPIEGLPCALIPVMFELPAADQRVGLWTQALRERGVQIAPADARSVAARYQLDRAQIAGASAAALFVAGARGGISQPTLDELFEAARAQTRHALDPLAQRLASSLGWSDLVLPDDTMAQLNEIGTCARHQHRVFVEWGFADKLSHGKGIHVLFAGPSGTGKTMAAQVLASELKLDLYRIDLAHIVSKYIGETEKNLDRIFGAARNANAILFFDEADALFGKRTEVKDAHDRYANQEVSYLLQKLEAYDGITVLATNMRQNIDEAFLRRFTAIVSFPTPDRAQRRRLWAGAWPAATPLAPDVDFDALAATHRFTGANIRNVALLASLLAAAHNQPVHAAHVAHAAARETQKLGKAAPVAEPVAGAAR
jgi:hypothetical protein